MRGKWGCGGVGFYATGFYRLERIPRGGGPVARPSCNHGCEFQQATSFRCVQYDWPGHRVHGEVKHKRRRWVVVGTESWWGLVVGRGRGKDM